MCSVNDDCGSLKTLDTVFVKQKTTCRSCEKAGQIVLQKKDVYCKDCFLASATHKFRATLGKSKMMKPNDKVLVALSANQSSFALLHMLHSGFMEEQNKKFIFNVIVSFVDDGVIHNLNTEERIELVENLKKKLLKYEFPFYIATLSDCFSDSIVLKNFLNINEDNDRQLVNLFENVKTMSSKEDLLYLCKRMLLNKIARKLQCNKIFVDEVGTDLAIKLLSCFSLGRGNQASLETGFCDSRFPDCKILRPLREFTRKEIIFYNHFYKVNYMVVPVITIKLQANCSIQKLTEKFVTDLQEKFPSTVYTIFRTGEKLSDSLNCEAVTQLTCSLCYNKIEERTSKEYSVINNISNFSKILSNIKFNDCKTNGVKQCCKSIESEILKSADLEKSFCYGCFLILKDVEHFNLLPNHVLDAAIQRRNLEKMKKEISEFLLVEN